MHILQTPPSRTVVVPRAGHAPPLRGPSAPSASFHFCTPSRPGPRLIALYAVPRSFTQACFFIISDLIVTVAVPCPVNSLAYPARCTWVHHRDASSTICFLVAISGTPDGHLAEAPRSAAPLPPHSSAPCPSCTPCAHYCPFPYRMCCRSAPPPPAFGPSTAPPRACTLCTPTLHRTLVRTAHRRT